MGKVIFPQNTNVKFLIKPFFIREVQFFYYIKKTPPKLLVPFNLDKKSTLRQNHYLIKKIILKYNARDEGLY